MKIFSFLFLMTSTIAIANASTEKVLLDRSYKIRIYGKGRFTCYEPVPPNGHNYPVGTRLAVSQMPWDLWGADVWTNVSDYITGDIGYAPCSQFANLTQLEDGKELIASIHQRITEQNGKNGLGSCMRDTREESTLIVQGVTFHGVNEFYVGPLSQENCQ